jgi:hypothetical protein
VRRPDFSGRSTEATGDVADRDVRAQLDRILQSRAFRNSERLQRFLKFAVECALEGTVDRLKESLLGRIVFDRGSKYDALVAVSVRKSVYAGTIASRFDFTCLEEQIKNILGHVYDAEIDLVD